MEAVEDGQARLGLRGEPTPVEHLALKARETFAERIVICRGSSSATFNASRLVFAEAIIVQQEIGTPPTPVLLAGRLELGLGIARRIWCGGAAREDDGDGSQHQSGRHHS
jgi:hypothetical protein